MKKNIILLLAAMFLSVGLFVSNQNVLAGSTGAQGGDPIGPCDGRGPYPDFCPTPTPQPRRADLAAAQLRHERNLPPRGGINSVQSTMHSSFSFFASILVLLGGIWALFILLRQRFNKLRGKNQVRRANIWELVFRPSVALSAFGFLFLATIIGSVLTKPTAVTAGKREKLNKSLMTGLVNPANKPVFKTTQQIGGNGFTQIGSPVFDAAGNRYVRGGFTGTLTVGATTLTATKDFDLFVAKYDANGTPIWVRQGSGATSGIPATLAVEGATALAVDAGGNVYIGGSFVKTLTLQGGANPNITLNDNGAAGINYESFVAKYDGSGNLLWAKGGNTNSPKNPDNLETGQNGVNQIVFDTSGNPYISGFVSGTQFFGDSISVQGSSDIMLAKIASGNGAIVWKQIIGGTEDDNGLDLKIDGSNNLYLIGNFGSPSITFPSGDTFINPGDPNDFEGDSTDIFIAKFDTTGTNLLTEDISNDTTVGASQIAVNAAGEVFITGYFYNSVTFGATTLTENEGGSGEDDASFGGYVTKMDANGNFIWAKEFGGSGEAIALDGSGRVYISGTFYDGAPFGEGTPNAESLASFGGVDLFVARYEANGDFGFAKAIAGEGVENETAVGNPSAQNGKTENRYNPLGIAYNPARGTIFVAGDFGTAIALDCTTLTTNASSLHSYLAELSADNEAVSCRIWNGLNENDNNWDSTDNWNGGIVPHDNDSVYVPYTGNSFDNPTYNPAGIGSILNNLTVAADRTLTLSRDLPIEGKLSLLGGIVNAGANNKLLDLDESATAFRISDSDGGGGLVIGRMRKAFGNNAPFTFPVGTADGYSPVDVNPSQSAGANLTINAVAAPQPTFANSSNRINRYWYLNQSGEGFLTANLTFHYLQTDVVGDESLLKLFKIEDGDVTQQTATINTTANTATVTNVSSFSDWTLAKPLAPTAATATVGGRVVTAAGRGIAQARVTLTNAAGESRITVTNTFGYYGFADTPTGATYILSVVSKRYKFPQRAQVQLVTDDRGDINFTAAP